MYIDHHDDLCGRLGTASPALQQSSFVKEASWTEKTDMDNRHFAVVLVDREYNEHKKFAMDTPANAAVSIAYLLTDSDGLNDTAVKLAAHNLFSVWDVHGLDRVSHMLPSDGNNDARTLLAKLASIEADNYSILDGRRVLSIEQPLDKIADDNTVYAQIKTASDNWDTLTPVEKRMTAVNLENASYGNLVSALPEKIAEYTGETLNPDFYSNVAYRRSLTNNKEAQELYTDLERYVTHIPLNKVAEALQVADDKAGLYGSYSESLPDYVRTVYGGTSPVESSVKVAGYSSRELGIMNLQLIDRINDTFTEKVASSLIHDPINAHTHGDTVLALYEDILRSV